MTSWPSTGSTFSSPHPEESTAYTYFTLKRVLEIASILGKPETPQLARIREYSEGAKRAYQELVTKDGYSLDTDRQAKLVRPFVYGAADAGAGGLLPESASSPRWTTMAGVSGPASSPRR